MSSSSLAHHHEWNDRLKYVVLLGAAVFVDGLLVDAGRAWTGFLMGFHYLVELSLAGTVFLALLTLTGARWAASLRGVAVAMSRPLPVAALLGLVLLCGVGTLYEWSHESVVLSDEVLAAKSVWLNATGFALRLCAYFGLWLWLSRKVIAPAEAGTGARSHLVHCALFMAVFAITYSLASVDWIMSLEPRWFSTIFALRTASGMVLAALSAAIVLVVLLERRGQLCVSTDQIHDLAKLLFSFSVLWVYIWYCQYLLIWYSNIPEETSYYIARQSGQWRALTWASLALNWAVPFLVLLLRRAKRSRAVLLRVAMVVLIGHAFDLFVMVGPARSGATPQFGLWESGALVGAVALFFFIASNAVLRARTSDRLQQESAAV
ncbi:MAG: hypothetical protein U1E76_25930 [Planctomycetota bacterium]